MTDHTLKKAPPVQKPPVAARLKHASLRVVFPIVDEDGEEVTHGDVTFNLDDRKLTDAKRTRLNEIVVELVQLSGMI